jgi:hypothetical protein
VHEGFNRKDVIPCAVIAGFCLYLFSDILLARHHLAGIDFVGFYLPMKQFLYDELHRHLSIPFWNPYIFGGMPYWAHFESTLFYPLGFLFWLIPPNLAYDYTLFGHLVLAGLFTFLLAREVGMGRPGSIVAGAVFACNGFVMALLYMGHLSPIMSYIWLPVVVLFLNRALSFKTPFLHAAVAGVFWGVQILAGAPQDAFYTFLASMLFLACHLKIAWAVPRGLIKLMAVACILFLTGAGLASIQIVPAFELIEQSVRASLDDYDMVTMASYPLQGLITTLLPHFFGNYAGSGFWVSNVPWSVPHQNLYVGVLPVLALFFLQVRPSQNKQILWFLVITALLALVLSLGRNTPVYKLAYLLPGFDRFRAPSKIIVLWVFALGLLGGVGVDNLFRKTEARPLWASRILLLTGLGFLLLDLFLHFDPSFALRVFSPFMLAEALPDKVAYAATVIRDEFHRLTILTLLIALLIILVKRTRWGLNLGTVSLCAVLLVDLGYVHRQAIESGDDLYHSMATIKKGLDASVGQDKTVYRVGSFRHPWGGNFEMYCGYQTVNGYTALFPSRYYDYCNRYSDDALPEAWALFSYGVSPHAILMDLLNVKYEISYSARTYALRETFLPRAFLVLNSRLLPQRDLLKAMVSPEFDPKKTLLLEEEDKPAGLKVHGGSSETQKGSARVISYRPDEIAIEVESEASAFLFLSETYYPGWKAFVDGQPERILRANYLFRAIELPKGQHQVRLVFEPYSIRAGIAITVITLLAIGWMSIDNVRKRARRRSAS